MFNKLLEIINNLDIKVKKIMINGLHVAFAVSLISCLFLFYYISFSSSNLIYYVGIKIMQLAISIAVYCFGCAIAIDKIKKEAL